MEREALDLDSDLSTFLRPCNRLPSTSTSNSKSLIPGPAGALQAAMMQRHRHDSLPTQEFVRNVFLNGHQSDPDFTSNPWLCALQFLPPPEMLNGDDVASPSGTPLSSINKYVEAGRIPQVVAVIKSCTPNGFGDMLVTLKDPTGTVDASVHRKVFTEGQFGKDISLGSVLVLQKVAVFVPFRSSCYLNITLPNILKIFPKECGPPSQQICPAHSVPSIERHEEPWMLGSTLSLPQERTQGIMTNLRVDSRLSEVAHTGKEKGESSVSTNCHSGNGKDQNPESVLDRENLLLTRDNARPLEVTFGGELESEMEDQTNPTELGEGDNLARIGQGNNSSSKHPVQISDDQETGTNNKRQKQIKNPKSSMPHWTDEQLDELLAFD